MNSILHDMQRKQTLGSRQNFIPLDLSFLPAARYYLKAWNMLWNYLPPCPEHQAVFLSWPWQVSSFPNELIDELLTPIENKRKANDTGNISDLSLGFLLFSVMYEVPGLILICWGGQKEHLHVCSLILTGNSLLFVLSE